MNEIQLRAWSDGKMYHAKEPGIYAMEKLFGYIRGDSLLMQYVNRLDSKGAKIFMGDVVRIDRYDKPFIGEVKQLDGGQFYIDHPEVSLKYKHQIHCEVCDTESHCFFLDFFDSYELEVIGNVYETPDLKKD